MAAPSLELNDDQVLHEQIDAVTAVDPYIPINHGESLLTIDPEAAVSQLEEHARLVGRLQQAASSAVSTTIPRHRA